MKSALLTAILGVMAVASPTVSASRQMAASGHSLTPASIRIHQPEPRSLPATFDPATGAVTLKLSVEDLDGVSFTNLRRSNFAVFENGQRRQHVTVDIEHSPITLAILMEMGGRSLQWNRELASDAVYTARPVLDALGPNDTFALFTYDDRVRPVIDFDTPPEKRLEAFTSIRAPQLSEANFYDAAIHVLGRLATMAGPRALLVISTGIDTFSHATFDDLLKKAEAAKTPIYVIGLDEPAHGGVVDVSRGPLSRTDWAECRRRLEALARTSGGRAYVRDTTVGVASIYDEIMERLRVRYIVTYPAPEPSANASSRTVQVKLVEPTTGEPLRILDASGRRVGAGVIAQASYTPTASREIATMVQK